MINQRRDDGLLRFELDEAALRAIDKALGGVKRDTRKVLKKAVNDTAKQARSKLADKTKETYAVKKGPVNKAMDIKKATTSNPTATINVTGQQLELKDYKTRSSPQEGVAAKVLLKGPMKAVQSTRGHKAKAFIVTFSSGHTTIAQRQEGQTYTKGAAKRKEEYGPHADMTRLKKLLSNSIPKMVGDQEKVYGVVEPEIYDRLMVNIANEIQKVLDRK